MYKQCLVSLIETRPCISDVKMDIKSCNYDTGFVVDISSTGEATPTSYITRIAVN